MLSAAARADRVGAERAARQRCQRRAARAASPPGSPSGEFDLLSTVSFDIRLAEVAGNSVPSQASRRTAARTSLIIGLYDQDGGPFLRGSRAEHAALIDALTAIRERDSGCGPQWTAIVRQISSACSTSATLRSDQRGHQTRLRPLKRPDGLLGAPRAHRRSAAFAQPRLARDARASWRRAGAPRRPGRPGLRWVAGGLGKHKPHKTFVAQGGGLTAVINQVAGRRQPGGAAVSLRRDACLRRAASVFCA